MRGLKNEFESRLQGKHNFKDRVNDAIEMERQIVTTAALRSTRTPYRRKDDYLTGSLEKRYRNKMSTLEIPSNEKLELRSVFYNEREREPFHILLLMRVTVSNLIALYPVLVGKSCSL